MAIKTKILKDGLSNKQRILRMVERWEDDIPFEQALYHLYAMKEIMDGIRSVEEEGTLDFDEVFDELEGRLDAEDAAPNLAKGKTGTPGDPRSDRRRGRAKNGRVLRETSKKTRKHAS
jgi:hypothetical protein